MRKLLLLWVGLCIGGLVTAVGAQEFPKHIMTGGPTGTYIQIGKDIERLFNGCGQTLNVEESAGSIQNILDVRRRRHTQFGIVQSDVLSFLRQYEADDAEIQQAISGVGIAMPLYNEEIHILARRDIAKIADLQGKSVGVGRDRSGTNLTATLVLDSVGVLPGETRLESAQDSLNAMLAGQLDAMFYVAGAPTRLFDSAAIDGSRFHLLPLSEAPIFEKYVQATIPGNTYPWQTQEVNLAAVKAVLMTFDFDPNKNAYHKQSCRAVSDLTNLVFGNLETLQSDGHPKWSQIDFFDVPPGWEIPSCVLAGMDSNYSVQCAAQPLPPETSPTVNSYRERLGNILGQNN